MGPADASQAIVAPFFLGEQKCRFILPVGPIPLPARSLRAPDSIHIYIWKANSVGLPGHGWGTRMPDGACHGHFTPALKLPNRRPARENS